MLTQRLSIDEQIIELGHAIAWMHRRFRDADWTPQILIDAESELAELMRERDNPLTQLIERGQRRAG